MQVRSMHVVGIRISQIMDYMVNSAGGFEYVGFTKKDLYNFVDADRRSKILDSDVEAALGYLSALGDMDHRLYCRYTIDEENYLGNIFWADSTSRMDYSCFGDVLVFDSTYKTKTYKMPFIIFVGINHHYSTTVFECALG